LDPDYVLGDRFRHFPAFIETHARNAVNLSPEIFWYYMRMLIHRRSITDWSVVSQDMYDLYGPQYVNEDGDLRGSGWGWNIHLCLAFAEVETTDSPLLRGQQWISTRRLVDGYPTIRIRKGYHHLARLCEIVSEEFDLPYGYHMARWIGDTPADVNCGHVIRETAQDNVRRSTHQAKCDHPDCNPYCIRSGPTDIFTTYDLLGAPIPVLADFKVVERLMSIIHPFRRSEGPRGAELIVVDGFECRRRTEQGRHGTYVGYTCTSVNCTASATVFDDAIAILSGEHRC
jgi:hypothetical protein